MKILVHSQDPVGTYMSSLGIRAYYTAQVLANALPNAQVTLAIPNRDDQPKIANVQVVAHGDSSAADLIPAHDVIISTRFSPRQVLQFPRKRFVADLFSQYYIEWMELSRSATGMARATWVSRNRAHVAAQLTFADFILCANERQRDTYIGMLSALGLIDPEVYDRDETLRGYIDVAPHGVRPDELVHRNQVLKGVREGIRENDTLILWNGGTVSWYDPEPFLRAMHILAQERDDIKALFLGARYPGWGLMGFGRRYESALQLSKDLGLYERTVFFESGWIPHRDVADYLLESDIGLCTYFDNLETRYSHRTRFLDLFWAELPVICTRGDVLAEMVEVRELGVVVGQGDTAAVAQAIRRLVDDRSFYQRCRENLRTIKPSLSWEVTLAPLVNFCKQGESYAVSKRDRLLPLLSREAEYVLTLALDKLVRRPR